MDYNLDNVILEIKSTPRFIASAKALSIFISSLPLTHEQHNRLIDMIVDHQAIARNDAFRQGVIIMRDLARMVLEDDEYPVQ
jgi:stage III sporulation protein SpoIIIAA